jgi:hypothetical protein
VHNKPHGKIRYFDFQSMRKSKNNKEFVGHANPATSTKPFIRVISQLNAKNNRELHATVQKGSSNEDLKLDVIAFPPKPG